MLSLSTQSYGTTRFTTLLDMASNNLSKTQTLQARTGAFSVTLTPSSVPQAHEVNGMAVRRRMLVCGVGMAQGQVRPLTEVVPDVDLEEVA